MELDGVYKKLVLAQEIEQLDEVSEHGMLKLERKTNLIFRTKLRFSTSNLKWNSNVYDQQEDAFFVGP